MNTILISEIQIPPNRQRQEFEAESMMDLVSSIEQVGLLQCPVLRDTPEGLFLVAGERRLKAIQDLWALGSQLKYSGKVVPEGLVPYITLGELSELEAEEAELDENLKRRDLTWQELASAHSRLHGLRQKQKNEYLAGMAARGFEANVENSSHTVADTAQEIHGRSDGAYQDKVRKELIVSQHLDDPEVAAAKSTEEAFKILKKQENTAKNIEIAERIGKTFSGDIHELRNINCLEAMAEPEYHEFIDVILTDPPYGMNAQSFNNAAGKMTSIQHHYDDSPEAWHMLMDAWCPLSYQVCKPQAHAYIFCDIDHFHELKAKMENAGWYVFRTPLICTKPNSGRVPLPDRGPRRQWEAILYAIKGKKPVTHIYPDVITTMADEQLSHGAQKPVALFKNLLQRSVNPGDVVLDCFAGTGTIIPACHEFKCKAIVLEQEQEYFATCVKRVEDLKEV